MPRRARPKDLEAAVANSCPLNERYVNDIRYMLKKLTNGLSKVESEFQTAIPLLRLKSTQPQKTSTVKAESKPADS